MRWLSLLILMLVFHMKSTQLKHTTCLAFGTDSHKATPSGRIFRQCSFFHQPSACCHTAKCPLACGLSSSRVHRNKDCNSRLVRALLEPILWRGTGTKKKTQGVKKSPPILEVPHLRCKFALSIVSALQMFALIALSDCLHTLLTHALLARALLAHTLIVRTSLALLAWHGSHTNCITARTHTVSLLEHKWHHCIPHIAQICICRCWHHIVFAHGCRAFVFADACSALIFTEASITLYMLVHMSFSGCLYSQILVFIDCGCLDLYYRCLRCTVLIFACSTPQGQPRTTR